MICFQCNALRAKVEMNKKLIADFKNSAGDKIANADNQKQLSAYEAERQKAKQELEAHSKMPHI